MPNSFVFEKKKIITYITTIEKREERKIDQIKIFQNHGFMSQARGIRTMPHSFSKKKKIKISRFPKILHSFLN